VKNEAVRVVAHVEQPHRLLKPLKKQKLIV